MSYLTNAYRCSIGSVIILLLGVIAIHFNDIHIGRYQHNARTQFEHGLIQSLTRQHLIHHKPWSQIYEVSHVILGRWNLNDAYFEDKSHYKVIRKFFRDMRRYKRKGEMGIHGMTLMIRDMHDIMLELDHFESIEIKHSLKGFWSKNPRDTRVIHTIINNRERMKIEILECLRLWEDQLYFESGQQLGIFVGDYLFYEQSAEEFWDQDHGTDLGDTPQETMTTEVPRQDPLDKWRKKAKFRTF